jgi:hypothetical protein
MSPTTAPPASCRPPPRMDTRNGTSLACRTQWCSSGSSTPRPTGSATPTTPAPEATTPHVSASWWSSTTKPTTRTRQGLVTKKPPGTREVDYSRARGQARPHLAGEGRRHQCTPGPSARARRQDCRGVPRGTTASRLHRWRSFRTRRTRARAGQAGSRTHQRRLRRQQPEHAPAS